MKKFLQEYKLPIILSLIFHIIALIYSVGHLHPDEHYQILEFLGFKLGSTPIADLPWEFQARMRPWFQPGLYYLITKIVSIFNISDHFTLTTIFRFISVSIGFISSLYLSKYCAKKYPSKIPALTALLFWPLPFLHARLSSEAIAATVITFALLTFFKSSKKYHFITGILFGISFLLRYHMGFIIFGLCFWALIKKKKSILELAIITTSTIIVITLSIVVDYWGYSEITFAPYNYAFQNIVENKAANYGVSPWWYYLKAVMNKLIAPIGLFVIFSFFMTWIKKPLSWVTFATLPFFIIHSLIGHKEWRFLFPLIPFIPIVIGNSLELLSRFKEQKVFKIAINFLIIINSLLLFSSFKAVHPSYDFYKNIQNLDLSEMKNIFHNSHETPLMLAKLKPHFYNKSFPRHTKIQDNQLSKYAKKGGYFFIERARFSTELENIKTCESLYYGGNRLLKKLPTKFYGKLKIYSLWKCK